MEEINEHPFAGKDVSTETSHDLDLGDGHWIDWSTFQGETCGGIISHVKSEQIKANQRAEYPEHPEWIERLCQGAFTIKGTRWNLQERATGASWTLSGSYEKPHAISIVLVPLWRPRFCQRRKVGSSLIHIYRIHDFDDEWLPLFNCTIGEFVQIIRYPDQTLKPRFYLVESKP